MRRFPGDEPALGGGVGENMNETNLYAVMTIMAFAVLLPISLLVETPKAKDAANAAHLKMLAEEKAAREAARAALCACDQWLGCPGTSAGVERLFSKAGSMHHDLKGAMEDGSLEHSLIATANTE